MVKELVKMKEKAFEYGTNLFLSLQEELNNENAQQVMGDSKEYQAKYIGPNVIDVTNFLYNNSKFYEYLKYSFLGKYYDNKINLIKSIIVIIWFLIGVLSYYIFGYGIVFGIIVLALIISLIIIMIKLKSGESYKSYYERTMLDFLLNIYGINFKVSKTVDLTEEELRVALNTTYDKKIIKNNMSFNSGLSNGNVLDLELIRINEIRDKNGYVKKETDKFFDGFHIKLLINNHTNILKGNSIKIIADENILSEFAEDTFKGIYESKKEFLFNSEEMNKSFDCKISSHFGFVDVDDMMVTVHKIITPSFEQHLLYLRERYNTFTMVIGDDCLKATFNMKRSLLQKIKHKELLDFKKDYREANEEFRMLKSDSTGIDDFAYYNVFPFLERLYLIKYLTYLYLSYMDFQNYYDINNESINRFEESMKNIFKMNIKEFEELYTEKIKEIKKTTKEFAKAFEEKEKK